MSQFIVPPPLKPGDIVRVIAPAGPFDRTLFWRGVGWLAHHFRLSFDREAFAREGFLAGSDRRRLRELDQALDCPRAAAIVAARGGVGCTRLVGRVDFSRLRARPKWMVGFSDITALHLEAQRMGVASLHAHNVTGLGQGDAPEREAWLAALVGPPCFESAPLEMLRPGVAAGPLLGGNLALLHDSVGCGRFTPPPGYVLFLEEIGEAPYRIDRMLVGLERAGVLDRASGIVVGHVAASPPGPAGTSARDVFFRFAQRLRLPLAWGLEAGHGRPNHPLALGLPARLESRRLRVGF